MIIVGQDKDIILNFNNTESIAILNPLEDNNGMFRVCAITPSDNEYTLGKYVTEERAKEVLQEIQEYIEYQGKSFINEDMSVKYYGKIYKMPKE